MGGYGEGNTHHHSRIGGGGGGGGEGGFMGKVTHPHQTIHWEAIL